MTETFTIPTHGRRIGFGLGGECRWVVVLIDERILQCFFQTCTMMYVCRDVMSPIYH